MFTPSADSRLIYVSSSRGNDTTGRAYLPTDSVIGADPFNPVGVIKPFRTIASAMSNDTVPKSVSELQRQSSQQLNLKFTKTYKLNKKR